MADNDDAGTSPDAEVEQWKKRSRQHEDRAKELAKQLEELKQSSSSQKSEMDKVLKKLEELEENNKKAQHNARVAEVARRTGLTRKQASRCEGETEDEMVADAQELFGLKQGGSSTTQQSGSKQGESGSKQGESGSKQGGNDDTTSSEGSSPEGGNQGTTSQEGAQNSNPEGNPEGGSNATNDNEQFDLRQAFGAPQEKLTGDPGQGNAQAPVDADKIADRVLGISQ